MLALPFVSFSQEWADDSTIDGILNSQNAFGDDETSIVVLEFWAAFNEANAFADWDKLQDVQYFRVDIGKAAKAKKEYRVRMAPTIIIFRNGVAEESFKAGLDLECPVDLEELQEAIQVAREEAKNAEENENNACAET